MSIYSRFTYEENYKYDWILEEEKVKEEYLKSLQKNQPVKQQTYNNFHEEEIKEYKAFSQNPLSL